MKGNGGKFRIEKDSMGEVKAPKRAYFGAHTQQAVQDFSISGLRFPRAFIQALGLIPGEKLDLLLDPRKMTDGGIIKLRKLKA